MQSFEDIVNIVKKLRSPSGCPWDREQNLYSLKEKIIEEAYELVDALDKKDIENIKEELGDLFLLVIFHTIVGEEENLFTLNEVLEGLKEKLIRRHPHVFSDVVVKDTGEVLANWEKLKKQERSNRVSIFDGISESLPSILKAYKLQYKAKKIGLDWKNLGECLKKLDEEVSELKEAINSNDRNCIENELGDLLFSIVNISRFLNISADEALRNTNNRFMKRVMFIEKHLKDGINSDEQLDKLWNLSKKEI